jgi:hypothetical protein
VVVPARQVVRRPVVQMVGSRHSSVSAPSITVTATVSPWWPWAGVSSPAGQPSSQASASGVTSSGTDQGRSAGGSGTATVSAASWAVSRASPDGTITVLRERMRASFWCGTARTEERPGRAARLSGWAKPDAEPGDTRRTHSASG